MAVSSLFSGDRFDKLPMDLCPWGGTPVSKGHLCLSVQASVKSRLPPGIDMNVNVLTSGYWPSYPHLEAKLPDELTRYQAVFKVMLLVRPSVRASVRPSRVCVCVCGAKL